ncbi:hypothetical protein [Pseudomonas umsongensis]|jgi:hypothetical protein|uniref:Uncharacterized protein n=1 Tax=Pseudomonas umsongensis TaxID=198618 RepID=A0AAE7A041_9PSED|nr:hypothetical protein HGP31_24390 [Pseudomonas umsongensis]QJC81558.1 hypothetical protein HGP31_25870 [Pseudomonas umsongensis]
MSNTADDLGRCDSLRKTWQVISIWGLPAVVSRLLLALGATPLLLWLPERLAGRKYLGAPVYVEDRECR